MSYKRSKIKSVTVIPQGMIHAVYYLEEDNSMFRNPVIFAVVTSSDEEDDDEFELWDEDMAGCFSDCTSNRSFIGYEYNGIRKNWEDAVRHLYISPDSSGSTSKKVTK